MKNLSVSAWQWLKTKSDYTNSGQLSHNLVMTNKLPESGPVIKIGNNKRMFSVTLVKTSDVAFGMLHNIKQEA